MGCASSLPVSSIEAPVAWSSLIKAEATKSKRTAVQNLLTQLVTLVQEVEALPSCKERDTLLRQTWTVRVQSATWDEEAAQKAIKNGDRPLMFRCQAACEDKLNKATEMLELYIVSVPEKAITEEAAVKKATAEKAAHEMRSASLAARLAALKAVRNPHDE